jgi:chloramphenicol-sensitive protein RarD
MSADSITGLSIEMAFLLPIMLGLQFWLIWTDEASFLLTDRRTDVLLLLGGVVTAVPLVLFAAAARRLQLSTIGLLQYLSPSFQLVLATIWFGESIDRTRLGAFALIWIAIAVYSIDAIRSHRRPTVSPELDA